MFDISRETASRLRQLAVREGSDMDQVLTRLLDKAEIGISPQQRNGNGSDDEKRAKALGFIDASPEEIKRINAPSIALLQAQIESAKNATPEEIAEAETEWDEHRRAMNENGSFNGNDFSTRKKIHLFSGNTRHFCGYSLFSGFAIGWHE